MPGKKNLRMKAARAAAGLSQTDRRSRGRYAPNHRPYRGGRLQSHAQFMRGYLQNAARHPERLFWEDDGDINTNPFFF